MGAKESDSSGDVQGRGLPEFCHFNKSLSNPENLQISACAVCVKGARYIRPG